MECQKEIPCKSINYDFVLQKVIENICNSFKEIKNQEQMPNIEQIKNYLLTEINQKKSNYTNRKTTRRKKF